MRRSLAKYSLDLAVWVLAAPVAYALRLDVGAADYWADATLYAVSGSLLKAVFLLGVREYTRSWHRVGLRDMLPLLLGVLGIALVEFIVAGLFPSVAFVPRSVPFIEAMFAMLGLAALRFSARLYYEERGIVRARRKSERGVRRVLIAGAGDSGILMAREMLRHPEAGRRPVGFVDDNPAKLRRSFAGLRVVGTLDDLSRAATQLDADEVLIAMPSYGGAVVRRVVEGARGAGLEHRTIPAIHDLASGRVSVSSIREVNVEDLLGRDPVRLNTQPIADYVGGKVVLVTGAGGSIGSEIVRQVAAFGPARILLLGRGENSVYSIDRELARSHPALKRLAIIADVRDRRSLEAVFDRHRPAVVFHAAAHKHVPLMEANPEQAVWNNVMGTQNVAELSVAYGAERVVNISTDKAVNPTNVMGASKRAAEMVVAETARQCENRCRMVSVRFGNVLGSRGSVVPLFREQILRGGPVTVTHPEMVRYFMTIPEAAQLVLQAGAFAENGRVYVLDMGEPVRIADLARDLILLSGFEPGRDIEITYSGTRPGEKLFEELLLAEEGTEASPHEKIYVAKKAPPTLGFASRLEALFEAAELGDGAAVRRAFQDLVTTYSPDAAAPAGSGRGGAQGDGALLPAHPSIP